MDESTGGGEVSDISSVATGASGVVHSDQVGQYVVFRLAEEEYAAPILDVQEIIPTGEITPFPNAPEYITGIINVRGTVATVVNLAKRFQLERAEGAAVDQYIILVKTNKALYGVEVDSVSSVIKIEHDNIRHANSATQSRIKEDLIAGVAIVDSRVILILHLQKVLEDEVLAEISEQNKSQA